MISYICFFLFREMRHSLVDQLQRSPTGAVDITEDPLTSKHIKKIFSMTKKLEEFYPHIFTAKLNTHIANTKPESREWYHKLKEIVFRQQSEMAWMPEEKVILSRGSKYSRPLHQLFQLDFKSV